MTALWVSVGVLCGIVAALTIVGILTIWYVAPDCVEIMREYIRAQQARANLDDLFKWGEERLDGLTEPQQHTSRYGPPPRADGRRR